MDKLSDREVPRGVCTKLWDHQQEALEFLHTDYSSEGHLLWMAMGTGKTLVAIEYARICGLEKILILCPLSVVWTWKREFEKHTESGSNYFVGLAGGSVAMRAATVFSLRTVNRLVIAMNYESFWRPAMMKQLLEIDWKLIVCDEIHRIKSGSTKQSRGAYKLARETKAMRLGLSGTPFPNSILDAFGSYRFLDDRIFGKSFIAFRSRYAVVTTRPGFPLITGYQNTDQFREKVHSIAFKVDADVLNLPEATHVERTFELPGEAWKLYTALRDDFIAQVGDGVITASNALVRLLRLQQMTSGDAMTERVTEEDGLVLIEEGHTEIHDEKSVVLKDLFQDFEFREPLVIFYRFTRDLHRICRACETQGRTFSELSGKKKELEPWQAGNTDVLICQLQAGSLGIDLTRARVTIFWSLSFNLAEYDQALARTNRPGQTKAVTYVHLIAERTVDRTVLSALKEKRNVIKTILEKPDEL